MPRHFIDVLDELRGRVGRMTALVQQSVELAIEALFSADHHGVSAAEGFEVDEHVGAFNPVRYEQGIQSAR